MFSYYLLLFRINSFTKGEFIILNFWINISSFNNKTNIIAKTVIAFPHIAFEYYLFNLYNAIF